MIDTSWNLPLSGNQQQVPLSVHLDPSFFSSFHPVVARWVESDRIEGQYRFCIHLRQILGAAIIQFEQITRNYSFMHVNTHINCINIVTNQVLSASQFIPWTVDICLADVGVVTSVTYIIEIIACLINASITPIRIQIFIYLNSKRWIIRYFRYVIAVNIASNSEAPSRIMGICDSSCSHA